eukprot:m.369810 g.369810  ORF g.369810 m.369810 type:complete len:87 (+) comp51252_c0_seq1:56-316(+)
MKLHLFVFVFAFVLCPRVFICLVCVVHVLCDKQPGLIVAKHVLRVLYNDVNASSLCRLVVCCAIFCFVFHPGEVLTETCIECAESH